MYGHVQDRTTSRKIKNKKKIFFRVVQVKRKFFPNNMYALKVS